ncbi:MAG: LD-carboxypeptidase [Phycisphaerales bacterium]|nr:LD-carboxypeptidase [Phycisphaerales bacterium]
MTLAMAAAFSITGCAAHKAGMPDPIFPEALQRGDTIAFVAPAGPLDRTRMELARQRLEDMGFHVRVPSDLYRTRGYLAGPDETRAAELMAAFADPEVKAIFPGTGGYGVTRMLDRLDYDVIRRNPKVFIGFSDITGLHLAIQKKTGLVTFHSPNPMWGLGSDGNLKPFSADCFWRALLAERYCAADGEPLPPGYAYELPADVAPTKVLAPGVARGRLTGGNLSLVAALMGTPYEIETRGRVLFLEDVGERPYRIDRYLSQLRLGGKLDGVAAVILGQFRDCAPKPDEDSLSLDEVIADYFGGLGVPVITNFPAGHVANNATLPLGALVEVDADHNRVAVLENLVRVDCR